jgi:cysteine desulfurase
MPELAEVLAEAQATRRRSADRSGLFWHVDATQAVGKLPVDVAAAGCDLLTLAAHKFHGPKGVGGLWIRRGVRPQAVQRGGPQERQLRGGTENVPGIVGAGVAAQLAGSWLADESAMRRQLELRIRLEAGLLAAEPDAVINGQSAPRLWNTCNIGFRGLEAEAILLGLSERGLCASAGAACSSGSLDPSPVLLSMGIDEPVAHGSVRFSLSRESTRAEVDRAVELVPAVVGRLRAVMPV